MPDSRRRTPDARRRTPDAGPLLAAYCPLTTGNIRRENSYESISNRYTFQGREWDAHAAHYHYRFRTYIPEWGSFTGPDMNLALGVLGEPNGMGSYLFCNNNPVVWTDPEGLQVTLALPLGWGAAAGSGKVVSLIISGGPYVMLGGGVVATVYILSTYEGAGLPNPNDPMNWANSPANTLTMVKTPWPPGREFTPLPPIIPPLEGIRADPTFFRIKGIPAESMPPYVEGIPVPSPPRPEDFGTSFPLPELSPVLTLLDNQTPHKGDSVPDASIRPYPNPDPPMNAPPVRYDPNTTDEVVRMRQGENPIPRKPDGSHIEMHHRQQVPIENGGVMDELNGRTHRMDGNHTRHNRPSNLTPRQRRREIRQHNKKRGAEYLLPGEGI